MKERGLATLAIVLAVAVLLIVLSSFSISALDNSSNTTSSNTTGSTSTTTSTATISNADDSYQCLQSKVGNRTDLSLQEAIFSTLALGNKQNLINTIEANKNSAGCWPKDSCKLKETALVALAYERAGKDNADIVKWISSKNASATDLLWYLEIDITSHESSQCKINYDGSDKTISINNEMKISGSAGSCLSLSSSGYWLRIGNNCLDKKFEVSCDKDFITTLLYQRSGSDTVYVSSETHSASSLGATEEKVNAKCFKTGSSCDYEGSLWATAALQKEGIDVSPYVPYLVALSEDNEKYFPSAFLYKIVGGDDQYSKVLQSQKQGKYWEITPGNRYWDISLAMLALYGSGANEIDNAKTYLLSIRTKDKCWNNNNIRDTAFILYSGWPKTVSSGGGVIAKSSCSSMRGFCGGSFDCTNSGGTVLYSYECSGINTCCSINPIVQSCEAKSGNLCSSNQECNGDSVPSSSDGTCCLGTCTTIAQQENTCEQVSGRTCRTSCESGEAETTDGTCSSGVCCEISSITPTPSSSKTWLWILILLILIVLVVIAILFKDKIRFWWMSYRGKAKSSPVTRPSTMVGPRPFMPGTRPAMPGFRPMPLTRSAPARPLQGQRPQIGKPAQKKPMSDKDKEMEETLRKLREMSK
ncbi:hypothetical protein J4217_04695 [Candidatus Pacearchaeota archaeon]|nr:hypothetical protein [Candidatus Pacearchaeota archaeon]